jgi:Flp pilus assembly protein TadG
MEFGGIFMFGVMKTISKNNKKQQGNALMYLCLIFPALIGVTGLVVDFGRGVWTKTELQRAADSGALSGAAFLPSESLAQEKAASMVDRNFDSFVLDDEIYIPQESVSEIFRISISKGIKHKI